MLLIGVDTNKTLDYNKDVKLLRILELFSKRTMEELENMAKGDAFMEEALRYVKRFLSNPSNKHFCSHYDFDVAEAREEGEKTGRKDGMKDEKMATAKRMLAKSMDLDLTAEITGLSIEVLKQL